MRARSRRTVRRGSPVLGFLMAVPAIALMVLFLIWPIITAADYSTTSASGFGDKERVGGANFTRALSDPALYAAFGRNIVFAVVVVFFSIAIGFVIAYFLYLKVAGWRVLQLLVMIPYIMPLVVTALLWQFMLEPENGLVNTALRSAGLGSLAGSWLTGESTALGSVSLVQIWVTIPFAMLLIFGAMIGLPGEVLEAAKLDGCGHLTTMFRIVLPMVRPTIILVAFILTVQLFRSFDLVYLLTHGGPVGATTIATLYVFIQGFVNNEYGYANALGLVIGIVLVALAALPTVWTRITAHRARQKVEE